MRKLTRFVGLALVTLVLPCSGCNSTGVKQSDPGYPPMTRGDGGLLHGLGQSLSSPPSKGWTF